MTTNDRPVHTVGGKPIGPEGVPYGTTHDFKCPACLAYDAGREARWVNPHRPGTKAHAKFNRERDRVIWNTSPRSETYWSS